MCWCRDHGPLPVLIRAMLTIAQLLEPLCRYRTNEVVITSMSLVHPWRRLSQHTLDLALPDSKMDHVTGLALGIALARPDRDVICLIGDDNRPRTPGGLSTILSACITNLTLILIDGRHLPIPGDPSFTPSVVNHSALAEAVGFEQVFRVEDAHEYAQSVPEILSLTGPTFIHAIVPSSNKTPAMKGHTKDALQSPISLADSAMKVLDTLKLN